MDITDVIGTPSDITDSIVDFCFMFITRMYCYVLKYQKMREKLKNISYIKCNIYNMFNHFIITLLAMVNILFNIKSEEKRNNFEVHLNVI